MPSKGAAEGQPIYPSPSSVCSLPVCMYPSSVSHRVERVLRSGTISMV